MIRTILAASFALAVATGPAAAGGLAEEVQPEVLNVPPPAEDSVPGWVIPVALFAALVALAMDNQ